MRGRQGQNEGDHDKSRRWQPSTTDVQDDHQNECVCEVQAVTDSSQPQQHPVIQRSDKGLPGEREQQNNARGRQGAHIVHDSPYPTRLFYPPVPLHWEQQECHHERQYISHAGSFWMYRSNT